MKTKSTFIAFLFLLLVQSITAQNFIIQRIVQSSDDISIYYDLVDDNKNRKYFIQVFSSTNNYSSPLQKVTGDVGIDVKPGISQRIVWNMKEELGANFVGDIQLEIRGKVYVPFIVIEKVGVNQIFKRAKPTELSWAGENNGKPLKFRLFRNNVLVTEFPNIPNIGMAKITLPPKTPTGFGYYFIVEEMDNPMQTVKTLDFQVKQRIPTALKYAPAAVVVGLVLLILPDKKSDLVGSPLDPPSQKK